MFKRYFTFLGGHSPSLKRQTPTSSYELPPHNLGCRFSLRSLTGMRGLPKAKVKNGGFTLVELLFVVFLLGVLLAFAYPHMEDAIDQSAYMDCESRLEMVRRAKSSYVIDHLGQGNPSAANGSDLVYLMYFPNNFDFKCPRSGQDYTEKGNLHAITICPFCTDPNNIPKGAREWKGQL